MKPIQSRVRPQAGFSLVELMVGMVIGLIAVVVMFQVFAVSEQMRRTTTGAGDAHQNAAVSLFLMERDARNSGYGFNYAPMLGCVTRGFYRPDAASFNFRLLPAFVEDGGGTSPDMITFAYGSSDAGQLPSALSLPYPTDLGTTLFKVKDSRFQFRKGDLFVTGEVLKTGSAGPMKDCVMNQVTDLIDADPPNPGDLIKIGDSAYTDDGGVVRVADYNPAGSAHAGPFSTPPYPILDWQKSEKRGGRLVNLGAAPTVQRYRITNGQLVAENLLVPGQTLVIADGIVQMQVQYGFSSTCPVTVIPPSAPPGTTFVPCTIAYNAASVTSINPAGIDQWGDAMAATAMPADWRKIIAVRVALVARSGQPDRPDPVTNACSTTTASPAWPSNPSRVLDLTADPNWMCYRYRVLEMTVPLRNMHWFADESGFTVIN